MDYYYCCRSQWPRGLGVGLRPLACWDRGFKSRRRHGCLSCTVFVCCQVEVTATGWSLVQRSPTEWGCLSVIVKPGGPGPLGAVASWKKISLLLLRHPIIITTTIIVCCAMVLVLPLLRPLPFDSNWLSRCCLALTTSRGSERPIWMHTPSPSSRHVSCNWLPHTCCSAARNCVQRETARADCLLSYAGSNY
jgi:hypothetical protein